MTIANLQGSVRRSSLCPASYLVHRKSGDSGNSILFGGRGLRRRVGFLNHLMDLLCMDCVQEDAQCSPNGIGVLLLQR
jgi:hypothetical protein